MPQTWFKPLQPQPGPPHREGPSGDSAAGCPGVPEVPGDDPNQERESPLTFGSACRAMVSIESHSGEVQSWWKVFNTQQEFPWDVKYHTACESLADPLQGIDWSNVRDHSATICNPEKFLYLYARSMPPRLGKGGSHHWSDGVAQTQLERRSSFLSPRDLSGHCGQAPWPLEPWQLTQKTEARLSASAPDRRRYWGIPRTPVIGYFRSLFHRSRTVCRVQIRLGDPQCYTYSLGDQSVVSAPQ